MRALTICQPWAWAIIHGSKRVENRPWSTCFRGPLLIHAGTSRAWHCDVFPDGTDPPRSGLVYGAIIGKVEVVGCRRVTVNERCARGTDRWVCGPWCIELANPVALVRPIPYRGHQRFFDVPDALLAGMYASGD